MLSVLQLLLAIHILGIVFWVGGTISLSRVLRVFVSSTPATLGAAADGFVGAARALWKGFVLGGMLVVLISGIGNIVVGAGTAYFQQGWFHTKLTLVVGLVALTIFTGLQMARLARGELLKRSHLGVIHGGASALVLLILLITYLGRVS
ncbi:MAG: CopD family protein [Bdellovibrionota bacterium]|jgi:uncharacterized membrane protein